MNNLLTWILHDQVLLLLVIINQTKEDTGAAPELAVKRKHAKYSEIKARDIYFLTVYLKHVYQLNCFCNEN